VWEHEFRVLRALEESPVALKAKEVVEKTGIDKVAVWTALRYLARRGLVKKASVLVRGSLAYLWFVREEQLRNRLARGDVKLPRGERRKAPYWRNVRSRRALRGEIITLLGQAPMPLSAEEIAKALRAPLEDVRRALRSLVISEEILRRKGSKRTFYYMPGTPSRRLAIGPLAKGILALLAKWGRASSTRLARELGRSQRAVWFSLRRLERDGLVFRHGGLWVITEAGRVLARALAPEGDKS